MFGRAATPTPPGVLYGCEYKGDAGKGIRKVVKTKGQGIENRNTKIEIDGRRVPHPWVFWEKRL